VLGQIGVIRVGVRANSGIQRGEVRAAGGRVTVYAVVSLFLPFQKPKKQG